MAMRVSAEQWAALRELRAGEEASEARLAQAVGVKSETVRRRARDEKWQVGPSTAGAGGAGMTAHPARDSAAPGTAAVRPAGWHGTDAPGFVDGAVAQALGTMVEAGAKAMRADAMAREVGRQTDRGTANGRTDGAAAADEDGGMDDARLAVAVMRQVSDILTAAEDGRIDKGRIDAVMSMIRMAGEAANLARDGAGNKKTRSDDQLADTLRRIDERIVYLARGYAERLVAERGTG